MACLKRFKWLIIPVFAILLMSHNTYAVDITYDAEDIWGNWTSTMMSNNWSIPSGCISPIISGQYYRRIFSTCEFTLNNLYVTIPDREYHADDLIMISFLLTYADESTSNHTTWFSNHYGGSNYLNLIDVDIENLNGNTQQVTLWLRAYGTFRDSNVLISGNDAPVVRLIPGTGGGNAAITPSVTQVWHINGNNTPSADDISNAVNNSQKQETQNSANQSQTSGDQSTADSQQATSSLISVIGGFVGVLTSASPTNCLLNANMNHIDMGQIDLCANPVPSYIQIIGSIILICAAIPLAIVLFNRFIGLFRSFQG